MNRFSTQKVASAVLFLFVFTWQVSAQKSQTPEEAMIDAMRSCDLMAVKNLLVSKPALVNAKLPPHNDSPLVLAIGFKCKDIFELLLAKGADVNARNKSGHTPLAGALYPSQRAYAEMLLKEGADVNAKDDSGNTPLHYAVIDGDGDAVRFLLKNGADTDAKSSSGRTALEEAVAHFRSLGRVKYRQVIMALMGEDAKPSGVETSPSEVNRELKVDSRSNLTIPDTPVEDQNGRHLKFYTDLVKGRTVIINFICTTCTSLSPPLTATFRKVQQELGERAGRDVHLISISIDPSTDVPERLKKFSEKFKAGPGWTFVTGSKLEVERLLKALGGEATGDYVGDKEAPGGYVRYTTDHTPSILVGNDAARFWMRTYGLAPASSLVKIIDDAARKKNDE